METRHDQSSENASNLCLDVESDASTKITGNSITIGKIRESSQIILDETINELKLIGWNRERLSIFLSGRRSTTIKDYLKLNHFPTKARKRLFAFLNTEGRTIQTKLSETKKADLEIFNAHNDLKILPSYSNSVTVEDLKKAELEKANQSANSKRPKLNTPKEKSKRKLLETSPNELQNAKKPKQGVRSNIIDLSYPESTEFQNPEELTHGVDQPMQVVRSNIIDLSYPESTNIIDLNFPLMNFNVDDFLDLDQESQQENSKNEKDGNISGPQQNTNESYDGRDKVLHKRLNLSDDESIFNNPMFLFPPEKKDQQTSSNNEGSANVYMPPL